MDYQVKMLVLTNVLVIQVTDREPTLFGDHGNGIRVFVPHLDVSKIFTYHLRTPVIGQGPPCHHKADNKKVKRFLDDLIPSHTIALDPSKILDGVTEELTVRSVPAGTTYEFAPSSEDSGNEWVGAPARTRLTFPLYSIAVLIPNERHCMVVEICHDDTTIFVSLDSNMIRGDMQPSMSRTLEGETVDP